ncbi:thioredoxin family protein [Ferrigenium sp. UT5]|uniref:thioredoxin family protein n=1 Tax=Ferrigenium sp. UT5 TaxID=3242105 RepID=UPI00354F8358
MVTLKRVFASFVLLLPLAVQAVGEPYSRQKLDALNRAGTPVLVAVHADWCSTCRAQDLVLRDLLATHKFDRVTVLRMDYDNQKAAVHALGVRYQSTLIVFKAGREVARSVAETDPVLIAELLRNAQ